MVNLFDMPELTVEMDVASLYPKTPLIRPKQRVYYESMYEMERIKRTMKKGTKVTPIHPVKPELFGKIGTVMSVSIEHGNYRFPTGTVEVVFDKMPGHFTFNVNDLALVNASELEEFIMKKTLPEIKKVIFSGNKTIVLWADNTKTIVSCREGETFDQYMGFCAAVTKKLFGSTSKIKKTIEKKNGGVFLK